MDSIIASHPEAPASMLGITISKELDVTTKDVLDLLTAHDA